MLGWDAVVELVRERLFALSQVLGGSCGVRSPRSSRG